MSDSTPEQTIGNVEGDVNVETPAEQQDDQPAPTEQPAESAPGDGEAAPAGDSSE